MSELDEAIATVSVEAEKEYKGEVTQGAVEVEPETSPASEKKTEPETHAVEENPEPEEKARERGPDGKFVSKKDEDDEEEPLGLSADELAAINADEKLQRVYKSMQRGLTKKTTGLADIRKQLEQRASIADWIQSDPDGALRAIAAARGVKLAEEGETRTEAKKEVVDTLESEWVKAFGDGEGKAAINILRPLFEKTAENVIRKVYSDEIENLKVQVQQHNNAATWRGILAAKGEFVSRVKGENGDWNDEIEREMAKLVDMSAGPGKHKDGSDVTIDEFLQEKYDAVMYRRTKSAAKREELKRLRAVRETTEPVNAIRPTKQSSSTITMDMNDNDAVNLAIAIAEKEARG